MSSVLLRATLTNSLRALTVVAWVGTGVACGTAAPEPMAAETGRNSLLSAAEEARSAAPDAAFTTTDAGTTADATAPGAYVSVDVASLASRPQAYAGLAVSVVAKPTLGMQRCTKMACSPSNPCCNQCSAGFEIGGGIALQGATAFFGCFGNSCHVADQCSPFQDRGETFEFRGLFVVDAAGNKALAVESFAPVVAPNACFRGGCSGEVCSDRDGVISACIFKPEFACYAKATCERQPQGTCGFTPSPELSACLSQATQP
jgi:hypothetical protein